MILKMANIKIILILATIVLWIIFPIIITVLFALIGVMWILNNFIYI